eukprot:15357365-Ditylum_brightwellii.AAC.1
MVVMAQTSVKTAISPSINSTVQMENMIKKSVANDIARILSGTISTMHKELNVTKPIANNIDTSTSIIICAITGEGNTTTTPKESTAKDVIDDNANTTATSSQDFTSDISSDQADETNEIEQMSMLLQPWKKLNALTKAALIQ